MENFHAYLLQLGYDVPRESVALRVLFDLYQSGEWSKTIETEFMPVWAWEAKAKALLEPFAKIEV